MKIQDNVFLKNNIEMAIYWIDWGQPKLTCQIHNLDNETMIISYKENQNRL
jgi:c-di-GMP-binding flagellar brake protein YcgR